MILQICYLGANELQKINQRRRNLFQSGNSLQKVIRHIHHSSDPIGSSSNTISPSESGEREQRLRGVYANVLCTSTKKEAVFFCVLRYLSVRQKPCADLEAFQRHLYVCSAVNLLSSTTLDIQRAETVKDKTSIVQHRCSMKVTAVADPHCCSSCICTQELIIHG